MKLLGTSFNVLIVVFFCSLLGVSHAQQSCNCVAFRLDSVQDFWLRDVQEAVIQAFIDTNTSLTIGIVANLFGNDMPLVSFLKDQTVRNPTTPLEIASNGWNNERFPNFSYNQQYELLQNSTRRIQKLLWAPEIKVFIPPFGEFNDDTLSIMRARNMTHYSSFSSLDSVRPYPLQGQSLYRFPSSVGMQSLNNPSIGITAQQSYSQISVNIARDGFAVVYLSITAFAQKDALGKPANVVNQTMIAELRSLIALTQSGGFKNVPISKINIDTPQTKPAVNFSDIYTCNCVAFRLDDIQDFFMTAQQYSIMNLFSNKSLALTAGIIAANFGSDPQLVNFVTTAAQDSQKFEIANHGLYHEDFSTLNQSEAISRLTQAQNIIQTSTGFRPTTMVLPYNAYNSGTIQAIMETGFIHFSSEVQLDPPLYDFNSPALWHFPIGARTSNPAVRQYFEYMSASYTWENIQYQLDRDGFAAVMVHPQEFSTRNANGEYTQALNQTALDDFASLLDQIKTAGIRVVPFSAISSYMVPASTTGSTTTATSTSGSNGSGSTTSGQSTTGSSFSTSYGTTGNTSGTSSSAPTTGSVSTTGDNSGRDTNEESVDSGVQLLRAPWFLVYIIAIVFLNQLM